MPGTDRLFLGHMLDTLDRIGELVARTDKAAFDQDWVIQSALMRELEVLGMVAHGHTSVEIAEFLNIGRRTVESHRASLTSKLGVRNQAELVRYAIERGLVAGS